MIKLPNLNKESKILNEIHLKKVLKYFFLIIYYINFKLFQKIVQSLPFIYQRNNWDLTYSPMIHGTCLDMFFYKITKFYFF